MTKTLFSLILTLLFLTSKAENAGYPAYYSVLQEFISNYDPELDKYADFGFSKTPDGWYVRFLSQDDLSNDPDQHSKKQLFWSREKRSYQPLTAFKKESENTNVSGYWTRVLQPWYEMNRNLYFGYNSWDADVIYELDGKKNINDTLRESLARAYGNYAHRFLWYQQGGWPLSNDPLQQKRETLAPVSDAAADSAAYYIQKSADQYGTIAAQNPWYPTMVGSAALKQNNQLLFGWHIMLLAGHPEKAGQFLKQVELDSSQITIAKKLLDECPPNAILLTYGDNDTYQPLYLQQTRNYRRDIEIINISLLGVPEYIHWLKKEQRVNFSLTQETFARKGFQYVYINSSGGSSKKVRSIEALLSETAGSVETSAQGLTAVNIDSLFLPVDIKPAHWKYFPVKLESTISPTLNQYYLLSDLLLLDIVNNNISKRPILFTAQEGNLFGTALNYLGMVYALAPAKDAKEASAISNSRQESVLKHQSDFIPAYRGMDNQAQTALDNLLITHITVAEFYSSRGNEKKALDQLDKAIGLIRQNPEYTGVGNYYLGYELISKDHQIETGQKLLEKFLTQVAETNRNCNNALHIPDPDKGDRFFESVRGIYQLRDLDTKNLESIRSSIKR